MTAHVVSNTTFIAIASTIATAAYELVASPSRYVCRYLIVLISKSDASIFTFAVQRQLLLHLPRATLVYAPPTANYFHYIGLRSTSLIGLAEEASKAKNQTAVGLLSWSECGAMADFMRREGVKARLLPSCNRNRTTYASSTTAVGPSLPITEVPSLRTLSSCLRRPQPYYFFISLSDDNFSSMHLSSTNLLLPQRGYQGWRILSVDLIDAHPLCCTWSLLRAPPPPWKWDPSSSYPRSCLSQ
ncbi:hypothetical protein BHE74_00030592 [Ensete ventricosum]|nr:hypothetical protein GW17_00033744 [Ensete ventricosum]RWW62282.1 hypothetical protein BHE74_00030592 [Ensete ventricosum]RZS07964.1 hypothetical protein BHM03_00038882 [Ensete ventricosum]